VGRRVIVDPAPLGEDGALALALEVEALGAAVEEIWLTHHHHDHIGGAAFLAARWGASVRAHPATMDRLPELSFGEPLLDGDHEILGGEDWEVLHTPGHARGHLAFRARTSRTLVAGDLVAGQGTVVIDPPEGDMADYLETLGRLAVGGVGVVIPAHGPAMMDGEAALLQVIAHRQAREGQVLGALIGRTRGRALDLVPEVYPEVPSFWHGLAARQVLAHLLKLEGEGRVRRLGSDGIGEPLYLRKFWDPGAQGPAWEVPGPG
jgi:glyoxylase-like metal-dependent hydrolase (beta-lactamase superfamily II)